MSAACGYRSGGVDPTDTEHRWFESVCDPDEFGEEKLYSESGNWWWGRRAYHYSTAFHWSMSQILAGGVETVTPLNSLERYFNIFLFAVTITSNTSISFLH